MGACAKSDFIVISNIIYNGYRWHVDSFPLLASLDEREEVSVNLLDVNAPSRCQFSSEREKTTRVFFSDDY
jgi:hypothetical protein